jgi:hypothetical protein
LRWIICYPIDLDQLLHSEEENVSIPSSWSDVRIQDAMGFDQYGQLVKQVLGANLSYPAAVVCRVLVA